MGVARLPYRHELLHLRSKPLRFPGYRRMPLDPNPTWPDTGAGVFMGFTGWRALLLTACAIFAVVSTAVFTVVPANGQAVISTHSGVVHYFEGAVYLDDQPLEPHPGRFPTMPEGSQLRTARGRAEVLLTPGVVIRLDENSAIRMLSDSLEDSRVELIAGSAMVESGDPAPETAVTLTYQNWQVRFPQKGQYRIDSAGADAAIGRIWVREGEADVTELATGAVVAVNSGMDLPLAAALVAEQSAGGSSGEPRDGLGAWSRGRADSISADNQIAANIQDPASLQDPSLMDPSNPAFADPALFGYTQFPMIGLAPISPIVPNAYGTYGGVYGTSPYGALYPYQIGFYSLYLPGYTYRPLFLGLPTAVRPATSVYSPRPRVPVITPSRSPYGSTVVGSPSIYRSPGLGSTSLSRPAMPTTVRPATPAARPAPVAPHGVAGHR